MQLLPDNRHGFAIGIKMAGVPTMGKSATATPLPQENGRHVDLRINDRCGHASRMIDVSKFAAYHLQMLNPGVVPLSIRVWE